MNTFTFHCFTPSLTHHCLHLSRTCTHVHTHARCTSGVWRWSSAKAVGAERDREEAHSTDRQKRVRIRIEKKVFLSGGSPPVSIATVMPFWPHSITLLATLPLCVFSVVFSVLVYFCVTTQMFHCKTSVHQCEILCIHHAAPVEYQSISISAWGVQMATGTNEDLNGWAKHLGCTVRAVGWHQKGQDGEDARGSAWWLDKHRHVFCWRLRTYALKYEWTNPLLAPPTPISEVKQLIRYRETALNYLYITTYILVPHVCVCV